MKKKIEIEVEIADDCPDALLNGFVIGSLEGRNKLPSLKLLRVVVGDADWSRDKGLKESP